MIWSSFLFLLCSLLAGGFAIAVVLSNNIVRMAFYLVLSLSATAGLFFLAGADFVGAMQLMIYVGGTLVLLVFGVMLTAQTPFLAMRTSSGELLTALVVGGVLLFVLAFTVTNVPAWQPTNTPAVERNTPVVTAAPIGMALEGYRVDQLDQPDAELRQGMSGYLFPFLIVSVHLLVVLVGAAYLARARQAANDDVTNFPSEVRG
ncbi:NADH-quinone oxidoreductase subunit J family protein [Aeoliella mucimassa]|uniref:NADH-quinone oxidoreductase subunit J n=1 Tax=Aeoliella mucimassa TaxID=2527972 RepID=A0A518ARW7_9BACT|nr:NADH-quinone oxidoreductase subunit J [Aeoliella mucimassa]QDU57473.1 NADH-quinone oxidoreductase subunit J [Aeoliella mucimassa]